MHTLRYILLMVAPLLVLYQYVHQPANYPKLQ